MMSLVVSTVVQWGGGGRRHGWMVKDQDRILESGFEIEIYCTE